MAVKDALLAAFLFPRVRAIGPPPTLDPALP
jgi:hypothetical protein